MPTIQIMLVTSFAKPKKTSYQATVRIPLRACIKLPHQAWNFQIVTPLRKVFFLPQSATMSLPMWHKTSKFTHNCLFLKEFVISLRYVHKVYSAD